MKRKALLEFNLAFVMKLVYPEMNAFDSGFHVYLPRHP